ncbi:MAG: cytochrome c [Nitrosomonadaceae bacterium]|nr:cytochrome c [Nitrosomonadaceae bacterium]
MSARYLFLLGVVTGLVAGCGESAPPAATVSPPAAVPAPSAIAPAPSADTAALPAPSPQSIAARKLDPEKIKRGATVYRTNCASCHGPNAEATPNWREQGADGRYPPPPLNGSAHDWHHSTATLEKMIREGSPGIGGMPAWNGKLTNQEIDDVIVWIKSLWPDEIYDIWYQEIESKQKN